MFRIHAESDMVPVKAPTGVTEGAGTFAIHPEAVCGGAGDMGNCGCRDWYKPSQGHPVSGKSTHLYDPGCRDVSQPFQDCLVSAKCPHGGN